MLLNRFYTSARPDVCPVMDFHPRAVLRTSKYVHEDVPRLSSKTASVSAKCNRSE